MLKQLGMLNKGKHKIKIKIVVFCDLSCSGKFESLIRFKSNHLGQITGVYMTEKVDTAVSLHIFCVIIPDNIT